MENEKITIEKDGKKVECDVLFTFDCDDNSKTYIGYTDHSRTYNGAENLYVSSIDFILGDGKLHPVTSAEEIEMIDEVVKEITQKQVKGSEL